MQKIKMVFFVALVLLAVNASSSAMAETLVPANDGNSVSLLNSVNPTSLSKAAADLVKEENLIKQGKVVQIDPPKSDFDEYVEAFQMVWDKGKIYIIIIAVLVVALLIGMSRSARL